MGLTCPTHIQAKNETGDAWVDYSRRDRAISGLKGAGFEVVDTGELVDTIDDSLASLKLFKESDVDCVVMYIETWNWADQVLQAARDVARPIIVWAYPVPAAWSIGGLAATHGALDEIGIKHIVAYGFPEDPQVMEKISRYVRAARVANTLRKSRYGSIGGQGMGIYTGIPDAQQWLKKFGIVIGFTDQYSVVIEAESVSQTAVEECYKQLSSEYGQVPPLDQVTGRSIRLYLGMKKIIEREKYHFTGVKCTFDLSNNYCAACLAQSRLSSEGFATTCLNDANGALTVYTLRLLTDEPLFTADVNLALKGEGVIRLIDDGAGSIKLAQNPKDVKLSYQPTLEARASGVCTGLMAKPGRVTLARLARIDGEYVMHIVPGEALKGKQEWLQECGYPMWPHAFIRLDGDMDAFVDNLRSEYIHMAYGDLVEDLRTVCQVLDIRPIVT